MLRNVSQMSVAIVLIVLILVIYFLRRVSHRSDSPRFAVGDRVKVVQEGYWANGVLGTIAEPSAAILSLSDGWHSHVRTVPTTDGPPPYYWVTLDESRRDADGDGPFEQAEIAERSLESINAVPRQRPSREEE
jgi:hypothetical protein